MKLVALFVLALTVACGSNGSSGDDDPMIDAPTTPDAYVPPVGFARLIGGTWTIAPGSFDTYVCVRLTTSAEMYVTNIMAEAPTGTHHTVLSISDGSTAGPDGTYDCGVEELGQVMLYASGVGTSPLDFPSGVGLRIPAGTQLHLNLHLFNASDDPISGESVLHVRSQPTPTSQLAEMVFAGSFAINLPNNPSADQQVIGTCQSSRNYNLFALWPHMHQIARHQKIELIRGSTTTILHDMPYSFMEQTYWEQSPEVQVQTGDRLRVTCTYRNNTGGTVTWGDSSNQEMCFAGLYRYPASGGSIFECSGI